ncbi:NAD(P)H-hydrate dehydratase [Shinella curvata]|uniref:Bifunctional NAD(P)H-hydrate repair enzyme n=1 Tax=Shinella curvata TaxID=1817964 RepID=A0ABT8X9E7_9HYPH|nr:NAD(P)H-hydrate dehydratase [Shinella curvata]MCJ8051819.1 NAD(P)H-hydrate dehydratase [Shinella curvata]MDO6120233.1 NAD(P)H-hydrate dehydratase [Shinella curvata]
MHQEIDTLIVTPEEMGAIDRAAATSGLSSFALMERAGQAVAAVALRRFPSALRFVVLCGPGNNGGDGYVAARALAQAGAVVVVHALGEPATLKGDAATAFAAFHGSVKPLSDCAPRVGDVVIDALFGAGLTRDVPDAVASLIAAVARAVVPVLAVDLPSGVDGRTGRVRGAAFEAEATVTFMCRKPGHLLLPGRSLAGALDVFDIGIPARILARHGGHMRINSPAVWRLALPVATGAIHKYVRGHLVVFSGPAAATGAARLSATAGLRAGAGLVTLLSPHNAAPINAAHLTAVMLKTVDGKKDLAKVLEDERLNTFVLGPGFGGAAAARRYVRLLAEHDRRLVLDADGISAFRDDPDALFSVFAEGPVRLVLTPHDGEFVRLFPDLAGDRTLSKIDRARNAAARSNGVVILKGADTVIAAPDGRVLVNDNAPPWLATAGSGDVLAGIVGAHLAQGMPIFEAAASAVWRHGAAGQRAGEGLTAETLISALDGFDQIK